MGYTFSASFCIPYNVLLSLICHLTMVFCGGHYLQVTGVVYFLAGEPNSVVLVLLHLFVSLSFSFLQCFWHWHYSSLNLLFSKLTKVTPIEMITVNISVLVAVFGISFVEQLWKTIITKKYLSFFHLIVFLSICFLQNEIIVYMFSFTYVASHFFPPENCQDTSFSCFQRNKDVKQILETADWISFTSFSLRIIPLLFHFTVTDTRSEHSERTAFDGEN